MYGPSPPSFPHSAPTHVNPLCDDVTNLTVDGVKRFTPAVRHIQVNLYLNFGWLRAEWDLKDKGLRLEAWVRLSPPPNRCTYTTLHVYKFLAISRRICWEIIHKSPVLHSITLVSEIRRVLGSKTVCQDADCAQAQAIVMRDMHAGVTKIYTHKESISINTHIIISVEPREMVHLI